jgi:Fumarylacetoacetase N-terminal
MMWHHSIPALLDVASDTCFPVENLPFGIFSQPYLNPNRRAGVAIADYVIDLSKLTDALSGDDMPDTSCFHQVFNCGLSKCWLQC